MLNLEAFTGLKLEGGFIIIRIELTDAPMLDALGRVATAQTTIRAKRFLIRMAKGLNRREQSVSLYHEVLEAAAVASQHPPAALLDFKRRRL